MNRVARAVHTSARPTLLGGLILAGLAACHVELPSSLEDAGDAERFEGCDLNVDFLISEAARDGIQSLDDARWVRAHESIPAYLDSDTRVIGLQVFGQTYAIPHNILWHHEMVNLQPGGPTGPKLAITYCPLTGSSLVFDRESVGGATIGVSGITFMNNLVLWNRREPNESLWPQMLAEARCGSGVGAKLAQHPFVEMEWSHWLELHPTTSVLAQDQGFDPIFFEYDRLGYPYGNYRESEPFYRAALTMPPLDRRRFSKERVVGLPSSASDPGIAFPFGALTERERSFQVVEFVYEGDAALVLWSDHAQGGTALRPVTESGEPLTVRPTTSGFEDEQTGSRWNVAGRATSGPLDGGGTPATHRADPHGLWGCVGSVPSNDPPVAVAQAVDFAPARENGPGGDAPGPFRQAARSSCGPIS